MNETLMYADTPDHKTSGTVSTQGLSHLRSLVHIPLITREQPTSLRLA